MSAFDRISAPQLAVAALALALVAGAGGYGLARLGQPSAAPTPQAKAPERKILYWHDPMLPAERYPGPGKSSMGMDLIPKYAEETAGAGVSINPASLSNLGARIVAVTRGTLPSGLTATGVVEFNQRDLTVVQARAGGFVQRVYNRAPGDRVGAGAPLADVLVPEWGGAQAEYLAVRRTGDAGLMRAARQRLTLLGMSDGLIDQIDRSGRPKTVVTISTPTGGVIRTLNVRSGMTVMAGQTLAEINGLGTVWINAAIPEALAGQVQAGAPVSVTLAAFPGQTFAGRVSTILPEVQGETRTLTARIELSNRDGRLKPDMFATVRLGEAGTSALLVPSEAIIRTGRRTLVMLALDGGRYQPAEIRTGREAGGQTEVLAGLADGEKVVASGQFLIDSEASLAGIAARPIGDGDMPMGDRP
ncbi:MAG: efflux RND transporter periplasmic adaptor subunit [Caulobacterales bacterium]|nr:efflux RND transporter periplasmic adaptor subunit [Caulobacterales bacterium]